MRAERRGGERREGERGEREEGERREERRREERRKERGEYYLHTLNFILLGLYINNNFLSNYPKQFGLSSVLQNKAIQVNCDIHIRAYPNLFINFRWTCAHDHHHCWA
jgi:hypothetical protein